MEPVQYLHTMLRVGDLDRSIRFYCEVLGFSLQRRSEYVDGKYTLAFLGLPGMPEPLLELTYNWGVSSYELGTAYGHLAFRVPSMVAFGKHIEGLGLSFSWGPSSSPDGKKSMAFLKDPDGYSIEILQ
jgi:lactoylglutathione lyase